MIPNLTLVTQNIFQAIDSWGQVDVLYMDFSKGFDIINHTNVLLRPAEFGFSILNTFL